MRRLKLAHYLTIFALLLSGTAHASYIPVTVEEADGSPSIKGTKKIVVSNGSLSASGTTATVTTGGGGGLTVGTTAIASGAANRILFENGSNVLGESAEFTFDTTNGLIGNESGGTAVDLRWEGDTVTHLLFVDASADKVGVGTSSPTEARLVVKTSVSGGTAGYFQNTGNNAGDSAIQAWTGNGGSSANTYMRGGFNYTPGIYVGGSLWGGVGGFSGDNGASVAVMGISAAPEGDDNDYACFFQGGSSVFVDTDMVLFDGTNGYVMRFNPGTGGTSFIFGSQTDLGGLVNIDGRADEVQLWIQGHSTQTNNILLVEKSDGTDLLTFSNAGAMNIIGSIQVDTIVNDTGLAAGTYTPTLTGVANVAASTAYSCQYMRVGNTVTVSGKLDLDPTLTATATQLGISLPVASNFANANELGGTAFCPTIAGMGAAIYADATNDRAQLELLSSDINNNSVYFQFSYRVI